MSQENQISAPTEEFSSFLAAWDPLHQKLAWRTATPGLSGSAVMATASDLVFQGHIDGSFTAHDGLQGRALWSFQADSAIFGAPISYAVDGQQFVAVLAGPLAAGMADSAHYAWAYTSPRRLLVFDLGGTEHLPAPLFVSAVVPPGKNASVSVDATTIVRGKALYGDHCIMCHGANAVSGGGAPDLRASSVPLDAQAFAAVLHNGALAAHSMPSFTELSQSDVENLRLYIRDEASHGASRASDAPVKP